jgi:hypothetical protein
MKDRSLVPPAILGCLGLVFTVLGLASLGMYAVSSGGAPSIAGAFSSDQPADAEFDGGRPVGLYFMTRFWMATGSLEKSVWYFAPDGKVYQNLATGFSAADLEAHDGRKGTAAVDGDTMTVTWADGSTTSTDIERDGDGFAWDMGIFTPVQAFDGNDGVVGSWEGGESISTGGNYAAVAKTLELKEDGSYNWSGVSSIANRSEQSEVSAGGESSAAGNWKLSGYSLVLTGGDGNVVRGIAFPYDDEKTPVNPDRFFFAGTMYKRL